MSHTVCFKYGRHLISMNGIYSYSKLQVQYYLAWKLQRYPSRSQIRIDAKKADIKTDSKIILQLNCKKKQRGKT